MYFHLQELIYFIKLFTLHCRGIPSVVPLLIVLIQNVFKNAPQRSPYSLLIHSRLNKLCNTEKNGQ